MQLGKLFGQHRHAPWFLEKYSPAPEYANLRRRTRQRGWRGRMPAFLDGLETGRFDPHAPEPAAADAPPTKDEDAATRSTNGDGAPAPEDVKEEPAAEDDAPEADTKVEPPRTGEAEQGPDRGRGGGAARGAEISVPNDANQVMIRTLPPDIGRLKLERVRAHMQRYVAALTCDVRRRLEGCLVLCMSRSVILCKSAASTVRAGSSSVRMRTCLS
jgi:hypothetical protein